MELKRKGPEVAEVTAADGTRILYSYGEPVAIMHECAEHGGVHGNLRIDAFVSKTTERHIAEFLDGARARKVPKAEILRIVEGA